MKPVDQTHFGAEAGNCFAACVASIIECDNLAELSRELGIGLNDYNGSTGEHWWDCAVRVLGARGYRLDYLPEGSTAPSGYVIMSGMSPRGLLHSTVALDGVVVHDPHPSRGGIAAPYDYIIVSPL